MMQLLSVQPVMMVRIAILIPIIQVITKKQSALLQPLLQIKKRIIQNMGILSIFAPPGEKG